MLQTLLISTPFFALVLLGFVAVGRQMLEGAAIGGLNAYVLNFALPCMLWRFGANTPIQTILDPALLVVYGLSALILVALTLVLSRRWRLSSGDSAMGALVAVFPNSGFLGLPLLISLLGQAAAGTVMLTLWVDMVLTSSLCMGLSQSAWVGLSAKVGKASKQASKQDGPLGASSLWGLLKNVLTNPLPWAIVLGAWCSSEGWTLPQVLQSTVGLLASSASPVALFALGGVLACVNWAHRSDAEVKEHPASTQGVVTLALLKLIVHPFLVWMMALMAQKAQSVLGRGFVISPQSLEALVLVAALPSASNVVLLAYRQGASQERIARIVMLTTAVSFLSFSVIKTLYQACH